MTKPHPMVVALARAAREALRTSRKTPIPSEQQRHRERAWRHLDAARREKEWHNVQ